MVEEKYKILSTRHPNHIPSEHYLAGFTDGYHGRPQRMPHSKQAAVEYMQGFEQGQAARRVK
jgi:hypothetical protein